MDLERAKIIKQNLTLSNALIIGGLAVVLIILFILELIISGLQAYIFTSLAYIYISETEWSSGR